MPKAYLEAEALMNQIKAEYFKGVKKISKDPDWETYEYLMSKFHKFEDRLTETIWTEHMERLSMSLCAIDCVFEQDKKLKEDARKDFQIKAEIISLLQLENFEFKRDYEEEVRQEWSEE